MEHILTLRADIRRSTQCEEGKAIHRSHPHVLNVGHQDLVPELPGMRVRWLSALYWYLPTLLDRGERSPGAEWSASDITGGDRS